MTSEEKVKQVYPMTYWHADAIWNSPGGMPAARISRYISYPRGKRSQQERAWADAWRRIEQQRKAASREG
jgi:hypothetical protein